jgi:hypothetical protein
MADSLSTKKPVTAGAFSLIKLSISKNVDKHQEKIKRIADNSQIVGNLESESEESVEDSKEHSEAALNDSNKLNKDSPTRPDGNLTHVLQDLKKATSLKDDFVEQRKSTTLSPRRPVYSRKSTSARSMKISSQGATSLVSGATDGVTLNKNSSQS